MTENITYFITGANRGIGLQLTRVLLSRANTTVVGTIRSESTVIDDLETLGKAAGSRLVILPLAFSNTVSVHGLKDRLAKKGINKINILILNAGAATSFQPTMNTTMQEMQEHFEINVLFPIATYQALRPLLLIPNEHTSKVVYISSLLGSIADMDNGVPSLAYGVSKAGGNYFVRKVHFEEETLVALAVQPGWVQTGNGQAFADSVGVAEPPLKVEESVDGVLAQIDAATKSSTSGTFLSYNGSVTPW